MFSHDSCLFWELSTIISFKSCQRFTLASKRAKRSSFHLGEIKIRLSRADWVPKTIWHEREIRATALAAAALCKIIFTLLKKQKNGPIRKMKPFFPYLTSGQVSSYPLRNTYGPKNDHKIYLHIFIIGLRQ